ncbi:MAG TPA: M48 family metallopeptidase [Dissulfurispiraceae bacterium]|nr:M48 family metallopeptidase [Dissulfurispiraceae bacterium]
MIAFNRSLLLSIARRGFVIVAVLFLMYSCQTVPVTGRQQISLVPPSTILPMSFNSYSDFISKHRVIENTPQAQSIKRVGSRIQYAVERYMSENRMADRLSGYNWEFNLVDDKEVNAWCMPGGKVVVYSGILPVAGNETGLAVVMGHEIAHAIANHGGERMSHGLLAQMGGMALSEALASHPQATQQLFMGAYGLGSQVGVLLPYSRIQESEADHLGLIFMAMAGYDPKEAVDFWKRMAAKKQGDAPPEFLSTHPADTTRIRDIERLIPEAMTYYRR